MAGNSNSGRRSIRDEAQIARLIDASSKYLLNKIESKDTPDDIKLKIALVVAPRGITQKVEGMDNNNTNIFVADKGNGSISTEQRKRIADILAGVPNRPDSK